MVAGARTICIETGGQKVDENQRSIGDLNTSLITNHTVVPSCFLLFLKPEFVVPATL
jgi:hypothetical protein